MKDNSPNLVKSQDTSVLQFYDLCPRGSGLHWVYIVQLIQNLTVEVHKFMNAIFNTIKHG